MRLKTPARLTRGLASVMTVGTVVAAIAGFAVAYAVPASADPHQVFTVVGSDTIENVEDQFALDEGANLIGSWDAVNPVTQQIGEVITPNNAAAGQCAFVRPDGSTAGESALRVSINSSSTALSTLTAPEAGAPTPTPLPGLGCVDWARSSAGPGGDQKADGQLVFIPFAIDAVTGAISSAATSTFQAAAESFTLADLTTFYKSCGTVTIGGVTYDPNTPTGAGNTPIDLYIPQQGSGTEKFWATTLGFTYNAPPACVHNTTIAGTNIGTTVEENDGTAVTDDPQGYMPFSIAQWIAQSNGHEDRRHSAILMDITPNPTTSNPSPTPVTPCTTGSCAPSGGTLNTNFPITREVYNIIPYANVTSGMTGYNATEAQLLAGSESLLCRDVFTITGYGFALLPSSSTVYDQCGATTANLRAFDSSDPV